MKKMIYTALFIAITASTAIAQTDAISRFFSDLELNPEVTTVAMSGKMFQMLGDIEVEGEEEKALTSMASKITAFKMVVDHQNADARSSQRAGVKKLYNAYEELASVRDKELQLNIMIDENGGLVREIVFIAGTQDNNFIVASLLGNIDLNEAGKLASMVANTQNTKTSGIINPDNLKVYPNPAKKGASVTIEVPNELKGGVLRITSTSGTDVHKQTLNGQVMKLDVASFGSGIYVVRIAKGDIEMTKKLVVE